MSNKKNYTAKEEALLKKTDAILELCLTNESTLNFVPAFYDKIQLLRAKRDSVSNQSVVKYQAEQDKVATVKEFTDEKNALAAFVSDNLGTFKEYAKSEKDANLTTILSTMTYSALKKQKPMDLVTVLTSFAGDVKKLKADRLTYHGLAADWVTTLETKVANLNNMLPKKESTKAISLLKQRISSQLSRRLKTSQRRSTI